MMQTELDKFKDMIWNSHIIREQNETDLSAGVPNHIYGFPNNYQLEDCGVFSTFFTPLIRAFSIQNYYFYLSSLKDLTVYLTLH